MIEFFESLLMISAASDSDNSILIPFVAGPAVFLIIYLGFYWYYRNTKARYQYEQTTETEVFDVKGSDNLTGRLHGVEHRRIRGENA